MQQLPGGKQRAIREFFGGVALLGQGLRLWITAPKLMLLGAIPALIVAAVYLTAIVILVVNLPAIATWATPFAADWGEPLRTAVQWAAVVAFLALAVLLAVYTFTALTLAVGDPFYEKIWMHVEQRLGDAPPESQAGFWRAFRKGLADSLRLLLLTALIGIVLLLCGLIPVIGQVLVPVAGALVAGWFLAVELSGFAFNARGRTLGERRRALGSRRAMSLGFGVATYLLFLVPLGAVIAMPAAVAGATVLSRRVLPAPNPAT